MIVIDTPEGIAAFRYLQLYYALKLEVNTGLRHSRGSIMNVIRKEFGIKARTKKAVLEEYEEILRKKGILNNV